MEFLRPANDEELARIADEIGAKVLRGPLRYPSETGGWQLGGLDLSAHLSQYRDREITVIIAVTTGTAEPEQFICGICGLVMDEARECPRCKFIDQDNARRIRARKEENEALFQEVMEVMRSARK